MNQQLQHNQPMNQQLQHNQPMNQQLQHNQPMNQQLQHNQPAVQTILKLLSPLKLLSRLHQPVMTRSYTMNVWICSKITKIFKNCVGNSFVPNQQLNHKQSTTEQPTSKPNRPHKCKYPILYLQRNVHSELKACRKLFCPNPSTTPQTTQLPITNRTTAYRNPTTYYPTTFTEEPTTQQPVPTIYKTEQCHLPMNLTTTTTNQ